MNSVCAYAVVVLLRNWFALKQTFLKRNTLRLDFHLQNLPNWNASSKKKPLKCAVLKRHLNAGRHSLPFVIRPTVYLHLRAHKQKQQTLTTTMAEILRLSSREFLSSSSSNSGKQNPRPRQWIFMFPSKYIMVHPSGPYDQTEYVFSLAVSQSVSQWANPHVRSFYSYKFYDPSVVDCPSDRSMPLWMFAEYIGRPVLLPCLVYHLHNLLS